MNGARVGRKPEWRIALFVALLHVVIVVGLIRAFAPGFAASVVRSVTKGIVVTVETRPAPVRRTAPEPAGKAAAAGREARPKPVSAPRPPIVTASSAAAPVSGQGSQNMSGANARGEGSGYDGTGNGAGAGGAGNGLGSGGGSLPVKVFGDINSARDYPRESRDLRINGRVIIALTVGVDGKVKSCRVVRASPDSVADAITCRLASERFRFRPATNAAGQPVEAEFGWQQRWFY